MSGPIAFNDMILCVVQELATINDEMIKIKVNIHFKHLQSSSKLHLNPQKIVGNLD